MRVTRLGREALAGGSYVVQHALQVGWQLAVEGDALPAGRVQEGQMSRVEERSSEALNCAVVWRCMAMDAAVE